MITNFADIAMLANFADMDPRGYRVLNVNQGSTYEPLPYRILNMNHHLLGF